MKRFLILLASCASACAAPTIGGPTIGGSTPVQYATQAEANAGTLTNKAISPSTLSAYSLNQSTGSISSIVATNISAYRALLATQNLHTIIEPLRIHHTSVDWIFDILSGGGNDLEISQSSGPVLISIDDSGNITARSGYYSGNGSGLTNVVALTVLQNSFSTNFTAKRFWIMDEFGVGTETSFIQDAAGWLNITPDSGIALAGTVIFNADGITNVIPASMRSTNTPGVGQTYYSINGTNGYWGAASSGTTYTNNVTGLPGVVSGAGIGSNYSGILTIAYTASTNFSRDAANLVTGTVPPARLGTGTPDSTKYLRGDSSWVTLGTFASQTPWGSEIDGNYNSLINVETIYGLDGAHGSDLSLHSYDSDATIKLYTFDSGNGIRYASQNGHTFTGPVTFLDGVSGGDWSIATLSVSSAYVGVTNATALATDSAGKMVAGTAAKALWFYKSMHPKSAWTATDLATRFWGEYDDNTSIQTNAVWRVPFACTATNLSVKVNVSGTLGSAENVAHQLLVNGSTVGLATTNAWNLAGPRWFNVSGSLSLAAGDVIVLQVLTPTFATDPTGVRIDWTVNGTTP